MPSQAPKPEIDFMNAMSDRPLVSARDIKAYVRKTRFLKLAVPISGVLLLVLIVAWPYLRDYESGFTLSFQDLSRSNEKIRLMDPRYVGVDKEGRRFEIAAKSALQDQGDSGEVNLSIIRAMVTLKNKSDVVLTAKAGQYFPRKALLKLVGGIRIAAGSGYEVTLDHAQYNVDDAIASSDNRVSGEAPFGAFTAKSLTADIEGRSFKLKGDVHVRIDPRKYPKGDTTVQPNNTGGVGGR